MDEQRYNLGEVTELAGVSARTVRYYIAEGLLPPPAQAGARSYYTDAHLARLQLIALLKDAYLPLKEIRRRLAGLTDNEVRTALAEAGATLPVSARMSAPTPLYPSSTAPMPARGMGGSGRDIRASARPEDEDDLPRESHELGDSFGRNMGGSIADGPADDDDERFVWDADDDPWPAAPLVLSPMEPAAAADWIGDDDIRQGPRPPDPADDAAGYLERITGRPTPRRPIVPTPPPLPPPVVDPTPAAGGLLRRVRLGDDAELLISDELYQRKRDRIEWLVRWAKRVLDAGD